MAKPSKKYRGIDCLFIRLAIYPYLLLTFFLFPFDVSATIKTSKQAQTELETLNQRIENLQGHLTHAQNEHGVLTQELSSLEKKIDNTLQQLVPIKDEMMRQNADVHQIRKKIKELSQDLRSQEFLLKQHIQVFYQMRQYKSESWLINPITSHTESRLNVYHQYLLRARQTLIEKIRTTKESVVKQQQMLTQKLSRQTNLEQMLQQRQRQLELNKQQQLVVLNKLQQAIENKQNKLKNYQEDKKKLTALLEQLLKASAFSHTNAFNRLHKNLSKPLSSPYTIAQKMRQGLTFFAPEGTPVHAVYSGKVVFSDWLKGYGLLVILDHGQGYMTLYAHNQTLLKKQGEFVSTKESIATVGHTGGLQKDGLYFEIRHRGKALPPSPWFR
ncbi:MAG: peptidoglycan DD-metalloendopeptidase family protein [Legionella sp.]|nr:peptidoglycan DD-metalloendopeptidase family protein [Legionella sp.]